MANFRHSAYWSSNYGGISPLAQGYSPSVTSFQNLDGRLDSFAFFVLQSYRNHLVVWPRLTAELVSQGSLGVCGQPGVQIEFGQHLVVPSSSTLDGTLSA